MLAGRLGVGDAGFAGGVGAGLVPLMRSYQYWARAMWPHAGSLRERLGIRWKRNCLWPNTFLPHTGRPSL